MKAASIRPATLADVPVMAAIMAAGAEPIDWPDLPGWPYLEHLVGRATTSVATGANGAVIGFGGAIDVSPRDRPRVGWLTDLFIDPGHQEHGAGRAILNDVLTGFPIG